MLVDYNDPVAHPFEGGFEDHDEWGLVPGEDLAGPLDYGLILLQVDLAPDQRAVYHFDGDSPGLDFPTAPFI